MDPNQQWNQGYNNQSWPQQENSQGGWNQQPLPVPQQQQQQQQSQQIAGQPPVQAWDPNLPQNPNQTQLQDPSQQQWGMPPEQQWGTNQMGSGPNQLGSGHNLSGSGNMPVPIKIPPPKPKNDESLKIPGTVPSIKAGFLMKSGKKILHLKNVTLY